MRRSMRGRTGFAAAVPGSIVPSHMTGIDLDKLRSLIALLEEVHVAEFEHEREGERIRIVRGHVAHATHAHAPPPPPPGAPAARADAPAAAAVDDGTVDVTSPFVGTF